MGPTWSLPQEELRSSFENQVSPPRPHAPKGQALAFSIPCLSSRTSYIIFRAQHQTTVASSSCINYKEFHSGDSRALKQAWHPVLPCGHPVLPCGSLAHGVGLPHSGPSAMPCTWEAGSQQANVCGSGENLCGLCNPGHSGLLIKAIRLEVVLFSFFPVSILYMSWRQGLREARGQGLEATEKILPWMSGQE